MQPAAVRPVSVRPNRDSASGLVHVSGFLRQEAETAQLPLGGEHVPASDAAPIEKGLQKLEDIVRRLEEGNLGLDESLRLYEEGIGAFRRCQALLEQAELKVRKLVETLDGDLEEEPFEAPPQ